MKKILISSTTLVVFLLLVLCSCIKKGPQPTAGQWQDNVYVSPWLNLHFELPQGWEKASQQEMIEIFQAGADAIFANGQKIDVTKTQTIYEFVVYESSVQDNEIKSNIIFLNQKVSNEIKSADDFLDSLRDEFETTQLQDLKMGEKSTAQIAGKTFSFVDITMPSIAAAKQRYYCFYKNGYISSIIITVSQTEKLESLVGHFKEAPVSSASS